MLQGFRNSKTLFNDLFCKEINRKIHSTSLALAKQSPRKLELARIKAEQLRKEKEREEYYRKLKDTEFLNSLLKTNEVLSPSKNIHRKIYTTSEWKQDKKSGTVQDQTDSKSYAYVNGITEAEANLILKDTPKASLKFKSSGGVLYTNAKMEQAENTQADMVSRVISMCNQDANAVMRYNLGLAIKSFARTEGDTASPEVQAAVFTVKIIHLADHLRIHKKDHHNRRIYTFYLHKRAKILRYLKRVSLERYFLCLKKLGLDQSMVEGEIPFPKRVE